jgi:DNA-binding CsgD family transcriptional regulator
VARVRAAVGALEGRQREVVELVLRGLDGVEGGRLLGVSKHMFSMHRQAALEKLKKLLGEGGTAELFDDEEDD